MRWLSGQFMCETLGAVKSSQAGMWWAAQARRQPDIGHFTAHHSPCCPSLSAPLCLSLQVRPSTCVARQCGNMYTASIWSGISQVQSPYCWPPHRAVSHCTAAPASDDWQRTGHRSVMEAQEFGSNQFWICFYTTSPPASHPARGPSPPACLPPLHLQPPRAHPI